jgi:hypothetical protein
LSDLVSSEITIDVYKALPSISTTSSGGAGNTNEAEHYGSCSIALHKHLLMLEKGEFVAENVEFQTSSKTSVGQVCLIFVCLFVV